MEIKSKYCIINCLSLFFLLISSLPTAAQFYTVTYEAIFPATNKEGTIFYNSPVKSVLTINDSVSYFEFFRPKEKENLKKPLGSVFKSHSMYINYSKNVLMYMSSPYSVANFIILDTVPIFDKEITDEEKEILGYKCKKGLLYMFGDVAEVWFTTEIECNAGPDYYLGFPGLVLEYCRKDGIKTTAKKVGLKARKIVSPEGLGKIVTNQEFDEIMVYLRAKFNH